MPLVTDFATQYVFVKWVVTVHMSRGRKLQICSLRPLALQLAFGKIKRPSSLAAQAVKLDKHGGPHAAPRATFFSIAFLIFMSSVQLYAGCMVRLYVEPFDFR